MSTLFSIKKAVFWILGTTLFVSGSAYGFYFYYRSCNIKMLSSPKYQIMAMVQTGPEKEALKTNYLAEMMDLSCDKPENLFIFDVEQAAEKLLMSPLIKEAEVKRIRPNALYVDYEVRKPVAILYDCENTAIDESRFLFPIEPFFSKEGLPEIYLGLSKQNIPEEELLWHKQVPGKEIALAYRLLNYLSTGSFKESFSVKRIDVSRAFSSSYGKREIVLIIEEKVEIPQAHGKTLCIFPKILRLNPKDTEQQLSNFLVLEKKIQGDYFKQLAAKNFACREVTFAPKIIDFRVPQLAFVQEKG